MEERKLNEKESLDLIAKMIQNTQNKLEEKSGKPFLIFGYIIIVTALIIWYLLHTTGNYLWNSLWFVTPFVGWPLAYRARSQKKYITTYIDRIINYLWVMIGITIIIACGFTLVFLDMESLFFAALILAMGATLTGIIIRFKPIIITGFIGMAISPVILFIHHRDQILVFAVMALIVMVIPGHILNYKSKKQA